MAHPVIVLPDPSGEVGRLIGAAAKVTEHEPAAALVGGLAVICRLATAHRVTLDADSVTRTEGLLTVLRARLDASPAPGADRGVALDGAVVEVIPVQPVTEEQVSEVDDARDRLFVAAHWWAYATAAPTTVRTDAGEMEWVLPVATPAALVATKTHAFVGRPTQEKVASDLYDLLLLVENFDVSPELAAAPYSLGGLVQTFLRSRIAGPVERTRLLRACSQAGFLGITPERMSNAFEELLSL